MKRTIILYAVMVLPWGCSDPDPAEERCAQWVRSGHCVSMDPFRTECCNLRERDYQAIQTATRKPLELHAWKRTGKMIYAIDRFDSRETDPARLEVDAKGRICFGYYGPGSMEIHVDGQHLGDKGTSLGKSDACIHDIPGMLEAMKRGRVLDVYYKLGPSRMQFSLLGFTEALEALKED